MENKEINSKNTIKKEAKKQNIFRFGAFYPDSIYEYYQTDIGKEISKFLNDKRQRLKGAEITYRVINHWENMGLLSSERDSEKGWRKYSIIDIVWTQIIASLRRLGCPLELILKVKNNLEKHECEHDLSQFPILEFYITVALIRRMPVYLLVFSNGQAEPVNYEQLIATFEFMGLGDHIHLSLNDILQRIYPKLNLNPIYKIKFNLSEEEMQLFFMIRMQDYESIKIKTTDGKIIQLEATEILKNEKRIIDILSESDYQDIEIKKSGGKINYIRRTRKMKYDKEK